MTTHQDQDDPHILSELGFAVRYVGSELEGSASVVPEMWAPDTSHLRTSILASWTDHLAGMLAALTMAPRVPVTIELDVHLYRRAPASGTVRATGRVLKSGRTVFFASVEFTSEDGEPLAIGAGSFMLAPDPTLMLPVNLSLHGPRPTQRLRIPVAQRAGCEVTEPGVAVLPRSKDGINSANTVNGGLIALVAEEAALSLSPGSTLCSLGLRYLQPVRIGPAVATAKVRAGLGLVEICDAGRDNRLACTATTRFFDA